MNEAGHSWSSSYRLVAAEKWKAKSAAMGRAVTEALVEYARPAAGMQVLDVASGTGEPAISLAERIGPGGHVSAVDLSPDLLEIAARRARQRALENVSFHQGDAHKLPFPENTFNLATCRFGVMFFADVNQALRELYRVVKPGARACFAAWGPFEQPYWQSTMGVVVKHVGAPAIAPGSEDPFRFAMPGSLSAALQKAGFGSVKEETRKLPWWWPGEPAELWEYAKGVSAPFRALLERVPEEKWPAINSEIVSAIRKYADEDGVHFEAEVVMASGEKARSTEYGNR
jgi:ubiquinone/menaquinone biosynthesis C-methylase UbiE